MAIEILHEAIYNNLCLLKEKGHKISFEQGMFRHRNQPGFEKVGYALLKIIDPVECKKNIPWPLVDNKTLQNAFRLNFAKFIKMINKKYPDSQIPELSSSNMQHPGGEKFIRFMFKLSTFALKIELERMKGRERLPSLPKFDSVTAKEIPIRLNMMRGLQMKMNQETEQLLAFEAAASPKLLQLKMISERLTKEVESVQMRLLNECKQLQDFDESMKKSLMDTEDQNVISDWNHDVENKMKELETVSEKICRVRDLTSKSCEMIKTLGMTRTETVCLDGSQLFIPPVMDELAGGLIVNVRGQVSLEKLLKAGAAAARSLSHSTQSTSQIPTAPLAKKLLADVRQQQVSATDLTKNLFDLCSESEEIIKKLIPVVSAQMEGKKFPEHLYYLDDPPLLEFICEDSTLTFDSPKERKRLSFDTMVNIFTKKSRVICSVKKRRSLSKYSFQNTPRHFGFKAPSTCIPQKTYFATTTNVKNRRSLVPPMTTKTPYALPNITPANLKDKERLKKEAPACRRSIYGKLPTGAREQVNEVSAVTLLSDPLSDLSEGKSYLETSSSLISGSYESSEQTADTSDTEMTAPPKKPRKSITNLVERYKRLKATMKSKTPKK